MPAQPNILWIVTTQWRAQACGYAGDPNAVTPALDRLAGASINFAEAVTPHPFGPFARAALFTGLPSPENGVRDYFDPLPADATTIAHTLGALGYVTAFFGKWHLARRDPAAPLVGEAHARMVVPAAARGGFAFWEGFESGFVLNDPWLHGTELPVPTRFPGYQSAVVCRRAGAWLTAPARQECPWFAVVSVEPPHPPYAAAPGAAAPAPGDLVLPANVPRGGAAEAQARRELSGYYAHIKATDQAIGDLLATLAADAQADARTVVVVTSVHGDMHGSHGLFRKGWPYEESIRVPLLVRLPAAWGGRGGVRTAQLASLLDLPRWAAAWAGAPVNGTAPGQAGAAGGERQLIAMPSVVAQPHQCDRRWHGVRTRREKLVLLEDGTPWLYFDRVADPGELHNLAGDPARADTIRRLRALHFPDGPPA